MQPETPPDYCRHIWDAGTPPMEHTPHLEPARRSKRMHLANYPSYQTDADTTRRMQGANTTSGAIMQHYARAKLMQPTPILPTSCSQTDADTARRSPPDLEPQQSKGVVYHQSNTTPQRILFVPKFWVQNPPYYTRVHDCNHLGKYFSISSNKTVFSPSNSIPFLLLIFL